MPRPPFIILDEKSDAPLYRQIYETIRRSILSGEFRSGSQLPATRLLATQLGVSRMTVINAYEQLFAEGYLEGKIGAGTFIASRLPEEFMQTPIISSNKKKTKTSPRKLNLSNYGRRVAGNSRPLLRNHGSTDFLPFQHGLGAIEKFPFDIWSKITQKQLKYTTPHLLGYGEPAGLLHLRMAVASHLRSARGVRCEVEQIIITNGAQQALDLIGRILLGQQDRVWIENPGYLGARDIFRSMGAQIVPIPVDSEGFNLDHAVKTGNSRLAYVTPSRQFPLGVTMSLSRRLNLLEWARKAESWIVEDDYDSEYRYAGRPLASLQGLDRDSRVIYIGTFSKTIFPALRLGCLVVPTDLIEVFTTARALSDLHSPLIEQAVLADFISEGHFARHIRRMRMLYEERQGILVAEVEKQLYGMLEITKADAGMHLIGWLPEGVCDKIVSQQAAKHRLRVAPVSTYDLDKPERGGLLLGYTAFDAKQIEAGMKTLANVIKNYRKP